jgi:hypothetical protein
MAKTKNTEITELRKADKDVDKSKVGKLETKKEDEVGGRALVRRYGQCTVCGFVGVFVYDTNAYHAYTCSNCGATLVA